MMRLIITILANGVGIYVASRIISGFSFTGGYLSLLVAAVVFALLNLLLRPILRFVTSPIIFITFGLFMIVVNMAILWVLDLFIPSLVILNLTALFWATLLIGIINLLIAPIKKSKK